MNIHPYVIDIPDDEIYIDEKEEFIRVEKKKVILEHSLYAISLWEMIFNKCFLKHLDHLTHEEITTYIKCMAIDQSLSDNEVLYMLSNKDIYKKIVEYLNKKMSATFIRELPNRGKNSEAQTSELLYYYLIKLRAPIETIEHWHINRLITLLSVFNAKDDTKHKRSVREMLTDNRSLNEERKKKLGTKG